MSGLRNITSILNLDEYKNLLFNKLTDSLEITGVTNVATPDLLTPAPNAKWLPTALELNYYTKHRQYFCSLHGGRHHKRFQL